MTDIFKMAEFFFNFIMGQRSSIGARSKELSAEIINQMRRIVILVVITIGALSLFCMGTGHLIERVLNNVDEGTFFLTPSVWVIIVFLILCILVMIYSTNKKVWLKMMKKEKIVESGREPQGIIGGQLESVVSLLVLDIIKEREANREHKEESSL